LTFTTSNPIYKFCLLYTRFWELATGSLIVFLPKQTKSSNFSFIGVALILTAVFGFNESMPNPSCFTLVPTLGTALVIVHCDSEIRIGRALSFKPLVWIGLISYSAYLIHQPEFVFYLVKYLEVSIFEYLALIGLIFLLAVLTWKFVENPFRNKETITFKSIVAVILMYLFLFRLELTLLRLSSTNNFFQYSRNFPADFENCHSF
jgi:peptidoglycan/LPS O-acetylase OafA/YrhL